MGIVIKVGTLEQMCDPMCNNYVSACDDCDGFLYDYCSECYFGERIQEDGNGEER